MKPKSDRSFTSGRDVGHAIRPTTARRRAGGGHLSLLGLLLLILITSIATPVAGTAAAAKSGAVVAWGSNRSGQLGLGFGGVQRAAPETVAPALMDDIIAIAGGRNHSAALGADGSVWTWGNNASFGELGIGTTAERADPTKVLSGATAIAVPYRQTLAVVNGQVFAWGDNSKLQLGSGGIDTCNSGFACARTPVLVPKLSGVRAVGGGLWHSLAAKDDGTVWAWGDNPLGQLGVPDVRQTAVPMKVPDVEDIIAVTGGEGHSLALSSDGTVYSWGWNPQGQLGHGAPSNSISAPEQVPGLTGIVAIGAGYRYSLALHASGIVFAWGFNATGQLGDGNVAENGCQCNTLPRPVLGLSGITAIAAGEHHVLALEENGVVWAWGENSGEQLGTSGEAVVARPQQVPNLHNVAAIGGGSSHSLAIVPSHSLTITVVGPGEVLTDPTAERYLEGAEVTLTPQPTPGSGAIFTGWLVDNSATGFASPLTLTIDRPRTVIATFAVAPSFCDVSPDDSHYEAIRQLAARGIIRGYSSTAGQACFGPDDSTQRAQMAALIARAFGWDQESHPNPFTDGGGLDSNLWNSVAALAHHGVAKGYSAADCTERGVAPPCFGPQEEVSYAQVISFISRAMVAKGHWQAQPDDPALYANVPASSGHRADVATYVHYAGTLPGTVSPTAQWADWDQPAPRSWFAEAEWRALNSHFGALPTR